MCDQKRESLVRVGKFSFFKLGEGHWALSPSLSLSHSLFCHLYCDQKSTVWVGMDNSHSVSWMRGIELSLSLSLFISISLLAFLLWSEKVSLGQDGNFSFCKLSEGYYALSLSLWDFWTCDQIRADWTESFWKLQEGRCVFSLSCLGNK